MLAIVSAALFFAGALSYLILSGFGYGFLVIGALTLLSLVNLTTAWGDRIRIDQQGIEQSNVLLALLGAPPRRVAWEEITTIREHRRRSGGRAPGPLRALILIPRSGRRMILDSLERFDEVLGEVRGRFPSPQ